MSQLTPNFVFIWGKTGQYSLITKSQRAVNHLFIRLEYYVFIALKTIYVTNSNIVSLNLSLYLCPDSPVPTHPMPPNKFV